MKVTKIKILPTFEGWAVFRYHENHPRVLIDNHLSPAQALRVATIHADYHQVPVLSMEGAELPVTRSTDPKTFCGITRPAC